MFNFLDSPPVASADTDVGVGAVLVALAVAVVVLVVGWFLWRRSSRRDAAAAAPATASTGTRRSAEPAAAGLKPEPAAVPEAPAFDPAQALTTCGEDPGLLAEILAEMDAECRSQLAIVRGALAEGESAQVHVAAHRIKGSLLMIAASPGASLAATIERHARAEELSVIPPLIEALEHELGRLERAIAAFLPGAG